MSFKPLASYKKYTSSSKKYPFSQLGQFEKIGILVMWGPKIKLHKWHSLWSTLEYWPNISYLFRLPRLGGDKCQQLIKWKILRLKIIEIKIYLIIYIIYNKSTIIKNLK